MTSLARGRRGRTERGREPRGQAAHAGGGRPSGPTSRALATPTSEPRRRRRRPLRDGEDDAAGPDRAGDRAGQRRRDSRDTSTRWRRWDIRRLSWDQLIALRSQGVSASFVRGMADAGHPRLTPDQLIALRSQGVSPEFVRELAAEGLKDLSMSDLVELRSQGVSPEYVRDLRAAGYAGLSVTDLVGARSQGVSAEDASALKAMGYTDLSLGRLVSLRSQGVSAEYVRELQAEGYKGLSVPVLIGLRSQGVTVEYVRELKQLGYSGLPAGRADRAALTGRHTGVRARDQGRGLRPAHDARADRAAIARRGPGAAQAAQGARGGQRDEQDREADRPRTGRAGGDGPGGDDGHPHGPGPGRRATRRLDGAALEVEDDRRRLGGGRAALAAPHGIGPRLELVVPGAPRRPQGPDCGPDARAADGRALRDGARRGNDRFRGPVRGRRRRRPLHVRGQPRLRPGPAPAGLRRPRRGEGLLAGHPRREPDLHPGAGDARAIRAFPSTSSSTCASTARAPSSSASSRPSATPIPASTSW